MEKGAEVFLSVNALLRIASTDVEELVDSIKRVELGHPPGIERGQAQNIEAFAADIGIVANVPEVPAKVFAIGFRRNKRSYFPVKGWAKYAATHGAAVN